MTDILKPSIQEVDRNFPRDSLENVVCEYIFRRLRDIGAAAECFDLGSVALALGWNGTDRGRAIAAALDFLSFCRNPILARQFALWSENDTQVLEQPICMLSDSEIRDALENDRLIDPISGEIIKNFSDRITVEYCLNEKIALTLKQEARSS